MIAMEPTVTKDRKRSDYRTAPKDSGDHPETLSFTSYLLRDWPRGLDWKPCSAVGVLWKLHDTPRNKKGGLSGSPRLSRRFVNWLAGEHVDGIAPADAPQGFTYLEILGAIASVRRRNPEAVAVLEWRQQMGPSVGIDRSAFMERHSIASASTLGRRLDLAIELVIEEVDRARAAKKWNEARK